VLQTSLLCATALTGFAAYSQTAVAAPAPAITFNIEAGALEGALLAYAAQSQRQLLFDRALVAGLRAPAVRGALTPSQALDRLLAGSGLVVRQSGPNVFVLKPASAVRGQAGHLPASFERAILANEVLGDAPVATATEVPAANVLDEVIVTGSLIRGADAPTSPVLQIDRDMIDRAGHASVADMLAALPQNFGGAGSADSALVGSDGRGTNDQAATGINLRGLGASATLVLVNGRRMGGTGTKGDFADVSALPTAVVERVDVLLDGASALYGSDAVGGVVNVVLKRKLDGLESRLRLGTSTQGGAEELTASQTFGTSWDSGDLVASYEYGKRWGLMGSERAFTATSDLRPLGGTDRRAFYSHPANILVFNPATASYQVGWAVPPGQNGVGLKPTDFLVGQANLENTRIGGDLLPRDERHSLYVSLTQDIGSRVRFLGDIRYNHRDSKIARPNSIAIFNVGRTNPFFVSPNGSASHTVGYSFGDEIGPSISYGTSQSLGVSAGLEIDLGRGWRGDVYAATALEIGKRDTERLVNSRFLNEAVGALADDPLTAYSAARDGYFNPFGDVAANGPAVLSFIGSGYTRGRNLSTVATFDAKADGPLWRVPAGPIKAAIGVQVRQERFKPRTVSLVSGAVPVKAGGLTFTRSIEAAFLELRVPLVDAAMAVPGVTRLELSLAGRVERYGDFGRTENPKLGLLWAPIDALKVRASYGTSFRAPNMPELYQLQNTAPVLVGTGADQTLALVLSGGNRDLDPEKAKSWTVGFDYASQVLPGLTLSATWFDVEFSDQIGQPVLADIANALKNPAYAPFVTRVAAGDAAGLAEVKALMATSTSSNIGLFPAEAYRAIIDARFVNTGEIRVRGFDLTAAYGWDQGEDRFDLAASVSYLADYVRKLTPTAQPVQLVDVANQPVDLRARVSGTWTRGPWGLTATLNHVDDYGSETGRPISAWTTGDLQVRWAPEDEEGPLQGLSLALTVQNLLDDDPPFHDSAFGVGYDPANADPVGRFISLQLTKRW